MKISKKNPSWQMGISTNIVKIKIRVSGRIISATPINPSVSVSRGNSIRQRGELGLPPSAGRRIRNAVDELGPEAIFSTVLLDECPKPELINRIRTHINSPCVGVIEYGLKNGWHIHIIHLRTQDEATKILGNYGVNHHEKVRDKGRSAWYMTKNIGVLPKSEHPSSWYFCTRALGRDEIFYVDSTLLEVRSVGTWRILDFCIITDRSITTLAHLKKLPPWTDPQEDNFII